MKKVEIFKTKQADAAREEMIRWLSHENELGKKPAKTECTNTFIHETMTYYIFKFKKRIFDKKWLVAVCGGYEGSELKHSGHIFSGFKDYDPSTEIEDAIKIVNELREYWMSRAKQFQAGEDF